MYKTWTMLGNQILLKTMSSTYYSNLMAQNDICELSECEI